MRQKPFPPGAVRLRFGATLVYPVATSPRSLSALCRQVDAMVGVCHFRMRAAKEAGMVSEENTKRGRQRLVQHDGGRFIN